MLLEINHVTKDYANHRALDDVSIQIPKGKIVSDYWGQTGLEKRP